MLRIMSFVVLSLLMGNASAGLIHYDIAGTITEITNAGVTSVKVGDPWFADLTILSASADKFPSIINQGSYRVDWGGTITLGSTVIPISNDTPGTDAVITRIGLTTVPEIELVISLAAEQFFDDQQLQTFGVWLGNSVQLSLSNDTILETVFYSLNPPMDFNQFAVFFGSSGQIEGSVQLFNSTLIPLPATSWLFLAGLLALCARGYGVTR